MILGSSNTENRSGIYLKSDDELQLMREAGHLLHRIMVEVCNTADEGITLLELDKLAYNRIKEAGCKPAFLGLYGFPKTLCISVNEEVVHGIPGKRKLESGDLISIDCGLVREGFCADTAYTLGIGKVSKTNQALLKATNDSLYAGIEAMTLNGRVGDIGKAVEKVISENGFHIIENYTGHGIGRKMHEEPTVRNDSRVRGKRIQKGLTVAIEPMVGIGTGETMELDDNWTVITKDRSMAAHFEHTVAMTESGAEILTRDPSLGKDVIVMKGATDSA